MPSAALTIKLGDKDTFVSVSTLTNALRNALDMLESIEADLSPSDSHLKWVVVKASMRSPLTLTIGPQANGRPTAQMGKRVVTTAVRGLKEIELSATLPDHFKEETLAAAQQLISTAEKDGARLTLSSGHRDQVTPTPQALRHIEEIVATARIYLDYGTIEGRLETVSVRGRQHFFVFETLTEQRVECLPQRDEFEKSLSLLGKRVAVSGRIRYRNHKPTTIHVENLKVLRESSELPQPRDIGPIDITGGLSSEEYIRRMRDAQ
jgi:hypothetical protein